MTATTTATTGTGWSSLAPGYAPDLSLAIRVLATAALAVGKCRYTYSRDAAPIRGRAKELDWLPSGTDRGPERLTWISRNSRSARKASSNLRRDLPYVPITRS